jgi:predicted RNA-binding protein with PIN domain
MRTFVIDGYNLLYAFSDIPKGNWQEKRAHLLAFLKERRPQGNNAAILVYDSREGDGNESQEGDIRVVFTASETADDWIGRMVRKASNPRVLIVVSNDQGIRRLVQGTGARFMTATEFLKSAASPTPHAAFNEAIEEDPDITEELKKKWL